MSSTQRGPPATSATLHAGGGIDNAKEKSDDVGSALGPFAGFSNETTPVLGTGVVSGRRSVLLGTTQLWQ